MQADETVSVRTTLRGFVPRLPYKEMTERALGKHYELSLVVCSDVLARHINKRYRQKTYAANVLSFPYSKHDGEIFLNVRQAEREAKRYGVTLRSRLALLFVHGLFHLKGYRHGRTMEHAERNLLREFGF